ncbi:MAG: DUF2807 domain-containing protein [Flavobacteriales bacterium]|nr:DUF2807 domain-containing protein [Flavobacteriales bacterium]
MKNVFVILCALLLLSACGKKNNTEERFSALPAFNKVRLDATFNVYLTEDTVYSLTTVADKKLMDDITYTVEDSVLIIGSTRKWKWLTPTKNNVKLYIHSKPLKEVNPKETCHIETTNAVTSVEFGLVLESKTSEADLELDCGIFYYWMNSPSGGKIRLHGKVEQLRLWNDHYVSVDARDLTATTAHVENNSRSNCEITVVNKLEYKIGGIGDIHLYGSPPVIVEQEVTSTGRLVVH